MNVRQLTPDQALGEAVQRHGLLEPGESVEDMADGLVGLHNTHPATPYLSLRARVRGFDRSQLDALMWESWRLVRFRAMRLTMFIFTRELLGVAAAATRTLGESLAGRWLRDSDLTATEFERLAAAIDDALKDGPLTSRQLRKALDVPKEVDLPGVVGRMCDVGRLAGGAPPRSWRSPIRQYHRWESVLPDVEPSEWSETEAVEELVRRYIGSYGPVTVNDMAWWSGLAKGRCRAAVESLGDRIEVVAVGDWSGPLYRTRSRRSQGDLGETVSALPLLDPYVQGYRDRGRFMSPRWHAYVYDGGGNSSATLVFRGKVIGVWQTSDDPRSSVRYHLFEPVPSVVRRSAESELAAAGAMYFDESVDVVSYPTMLPLNEEGGRSAMHPLDGRMHRASRRTSPWDVAASNGVP